ncbi:hypothetical protein [Streptomyces sp. NPDC006855]|uniref:hypothetical protein n=1 Tax=Streptomyces sp. NPDC006855 TaxID=3364765 RepID=UPI00369D900F
MAVQRCVESFTVWRGGVPVTFTAGQLLEEKHPILKTHGHLFQDVATAARPRQAQRVEAAVNDPGTSRNLTPPTEPGASSPDPFDPTQHVTKDVLAYLGTVGEAEALRVLDAEAAGENRAGIRKVRDQVLEDARARDAAGE